MRIRHLIVSPLVLSPLVLALAGCTFSKFNDYERRAPAAKVEQDGDRSSGAFGSDIAAMLRRRGAEEPVAGATLLVAGNGPVAINTVTFSADGSFSNSEADNDDFREDLGEPDQITALSSAPAMTVSGYNGPFAYVGVSRQKVGAVRVIDVNNYGGPGELTAPEDGIENFGLAVRAVNIGGGDSADDLAVGAKGAVVLWRAAGWPNFTRPADAVIVDESPRWPASGNFETIAAGQLATSGRDEIAVGARDKNYVAVIHHVAGFGGGGSCEGACVDTTADANHCGSCGNACEGSEACIAGQCRIPDACSAPLETCGSLCVNTDVDNKNCGGCGKVCDTDKGLACRAGTCACAAGRVECGGVCVDVVASRDNCGSCGKACGSGERCQLGQCKATPCPDGLTECDGACVDLTASADHCGACGDRCTGNLGCQRSQCACVPFEVLEIPLPDNANGFGASLLVANVDKDPESELVIGAPDSNGGGAVYVYRLRDEHFDGTAQVPDPTVISAPSGAKSFGGALAVGRFNTKDQLLAIGAPSTDVEGTGSAGKVYLYDSQIKDPAGTVELVRPAGGGQLGNALATMPFKATDDTYDVLVSSSNTAVYVFFGSTTPDHADVRNR